MTGKTIALIALVMMVSIPGWSQISRVFATKSDIRQYYHDTTVRAAPIPRRVLSAFAAAEDPDFYDKIAGTSRITSQVSRWFLPARSSAFKRFVMAQLLGLSLSHQEILTLYVQKIFLGQSCFGAPDAAIAYFGKSLDDLAIADLAYLAALPNAPVRFHPVRYADKALKRRNFVLMQIQEAGAISTQQLAVALTAELGVRLPLQLCAGR